MEVFNVISKAKKFKADANHLSEYYRTYIFNDAALEFLEDEDFSNLIDVARYADFGVWTAIEAAFCLGYKAGTIN